MSMDITNIIAQYAETASYAADAVAPVAEITNQAEGLKQLGKGIGAGLAMLGMIGVGFGEGITAAAAATAVGRNPEAQPKVMNIMIVGMAITESVAIYALIVSILIIFVM